MKKGIVYFISTVVLVSFLILPVSANAGFRDIPRDHWAYNEITFLTNKKVITNCSNCTFSPMATLTRKDAAIMLVRAMKLKAPTKPKLVPSDMKSNTSGYKEVVTLVNKGIFTLSNKKFNPNQPLTRKEMARALAKSYDYKGKGKSKYKDVPKSHPYYPYIDAIVENEIGSGYKDGTFKPEVTVNKAQFAVFLARIYNEPLEYIVKQNGKILHKVRKSDEAIKLALRYPKATVHPVSNSLQTYSTKTATMTKTGIRNGVLIYNGANEKESFTPEFFDPYLVKDIKNKTGNMFDTFIVLGIRYPNGGEFVETAKNIAHYKEWQWYINQTFASHGALANLNKSAKNLNKKVNVYISIPYPRRTGTLKGLDGKNRTITAAEREKLVNWYVKTVQAKWNAAGYKNINLKGYYWLSESMGHQQDEILVQKIAATIHKQKKMFIYSPHALSSNFDRWQTYGFDGAYLQPNTFRLKFTDVEVQTRLHNAFLRAQIYGSGINLEIDQYSADKIVAGLKNYSQYTEMAQRYELPGRSFIHYQGTEMVNRMANYKQQPYDEAHQLLQGIIK